MGPNEYGVVTAPIVCAGLSPSKLIATMLLRFAPGNMLKGILTSPDHMDIE
jgi:hypothetical protein